MHPRDALARLAPLAAAVAAILALGGCTGPTTPASTAGGSPVPTAAPELPPEADPAALLGTWRVTADREEPDLALAIGARAFGVLRACGLVRGDLAWDGRALAARVAGFPESCIAGGQAPRVDWMLAADRWRVVDDGIELLADDEVVATLRPDDAPPAAFATAYDLQPATADELAALREPVERPGTGEPIAPSLLVGIWHDAADPATTVSYAADGGWSVDDGCNGGAGAGRIGPDGRMLSIAGPTTLMGCPHSSGLGGTLGLAAWAIAEGDDVRLLDADGESIVRLVRGIADDDAAG